MIRSINLVGIGLLMTSLMAAQDSQPNPGLKPKDASEAPTAEGLKLFESKIRPVLVANCYGCHSSEAKSLKAGLRLDTRDGLLQGGRLSIDEVARLAMGSPFTGISSIASDITLRRN